VRRRLVYRGILLFFYKHKGAVQTLLLRLMYICISSIKIPFWLIGTLSGKFRGRAANELRSNLSILRMSLKPGIEPPLI
jgi:hypothetical protein